MNEYVLLERSKNHTPEASVTPHILRIIELKKSGVVILQGRDGTTVSRQVAQLAHCSVPVADHKIYPEKFTKTKSVHCQICGSRNNEAFMLLCDTCNKGFHTFCFDIPMQEVPTEKWNCEAHEVNNKM